MSQAFFARRPRLGARCASVLAILLAASGAAASQAEEGRDPLRISGMLQTIELAPVHVAADRIYPGGAAVRNGGIPILFLPPEEKPSHVATHAETQALRNSLSRPDLRIILTVARGHYRIVARRSSGIETLADLRGKRIATMGPTSAGFYLHNVLASAGLSEADVRIVNVPRPQEISRSIIAKEADALVIWEPEMQRAVDALGDDAILFQPDVGYDELFNLNTTAGNLADPHRRAQIVRFVAALMRTSREAKADPTLAIQMVADKTGYPVDLIRKAWPHHSFPAALAPDLLDVLVREEAWLARQEGRPARDRDALARLIDPSVARDARALLEREPG
ncbi:ABC transporter substrate-binding protein [Sphingobium lignivorans]|uniref:NitT/TauT family transport system substrate-binding protein n=1 Tax=Sphingobium lignivorans TaxID=2735886 RepID=A0ABR6NLF6_9SPHN|nr:NitT/TauT family transport system substrate-binding protein [Sphingobium lignivorans]